MIATIRRAWFALAPKVLAFLATGLTSSGLLALATAFGINLDPGFAVLVVGILSTIAGAAVRDKYLELPWNTWAPKLVVLAASSVTGAGLVTLLSYVGVELNPAIAAAIVTLLAGIAGYLKSDTSIIVSSPALDPLALTIDTRTAEGLEDSASKLLAIATEVRTRDGS